MLACNEASPTQEASSADMEMIVDATVSVDMEPEPDLSVLPDAAVGPERLPYGDPAPANSRLAVEGHQGGWDVLNDGRIVYENDNQLWLVQDGDTTGWPMDGQLLDAALVDGTVLVLNSNGLYALGPLGLEPSPLQMSLGQVSQLRPDGRGGLWVVDSEGLHYWREGTFKSVQLPDIELTLAQRRSATGTYDNGHVLWICDRDQLIAVGENRAWRFDWPNPIDWITATADGLWVAADQELALIATDGAISTWARPGGSSVGVGHPKRRHLWLSSGVELHHWDGSAFRLRDDAPDHASVRSDANGALHLATARGIETVIGGRFLALAGLDNNGRVASPTEVTVEPSDGERVTSVMVAIDGAEPIPVENSNGWTFVLNPSDIGPGSHELIVVVRYDDEVELQTKVQFFGPPSWEEDIRTISETYCVACHGDGGSAHRMVTREEWTAEIVMIIDDIETGRMPYGLPPLSDDLVQLVRDWQTSGFLE